MSVLSVIVPAYNEHSMIKKTSSVISQMLDEAKIDFEIVFVDDGSRDGTYEVIKEVSDENNRVRGISFSRNFGKEAAILAGLSESKGDCCVVIDCDLQQPPAVILEMYRLWQQGYKVVNGVKSSRGREGVLHRFAAKIFYSVMSAVIKIDMRKASDYKLLDREVVQVLLSMPERNYFFRALSEWVGFKSTSVEYDVAERENGKSKWSTWSLIKYATTNITSFSSLPLHIITFLGVFVFVVAIVMGLISLIQYFCGVAVAGFTTVILLILLIGSVIMISLGIIGYYISKIYEEIKQRPKFLIEKRTETDKRP